MYCSSPRSVKLIVFHLQPGFKRQPIELRLDRGREIGEVTGESPGESTRYPGFHRFSTAKDMPSVLPVLLA